MLVIYHNFTEACSFRFRWQKQVFDNMAFLSDFVKNQSINIFGSNILQGKDFDDQDHNIFSFIQNDDKYAYAINSLGPGVSIWPRGF